MSAPDLPETFGNYALGEFVEVVAPGSINWLPQTSGWWWLAAGLSLLIVRALIKRLRRWPQNRYRREAEIRLRALDEGNCEENFVLEINRLLKITAMVAFGREPVARLSGNAWVAFLNAQCPQPAFSHSQEQLLAHTAYSPEPPDAQARSQLLAACMHWVKNHEIEPHA